MSDLDGKVIAVMCFEFLTNLFTELTVHVCNRFTHLKLIKEIACWKDYFPFTVYMAAPYNGW